ncbi:MAG: OsmC family protein [Rhodospirillales bacterium]|nr:OsmC family protein [Rhodospirillales bacterium]
MKARVKWVDEVMFIGESPSGHAIIMDGSLEVGGRNMGVRPMEMLLLGMGGCSSFDVVGILKKSRADLVDCVVELEAERADDIPKVFTRIHAHYIVSGRKLKPADVERAITLSVEKYCSASIMLGKTATLTHDFEIVEV